MINDIAIPKAGVSYSLVIRLIFGHLIILSATYIAYGLITGHTLMPRHGNFLSGDAINYETIKNQGYSFDSSKQSTVAFFPGFPYLWRLTGLGVYGISILNMCLFLGGFAWLCRQFSPNRMEILIYLSLPPALFMYVPFSEALFFVPSALLLTGLLKRNTVMVIIALFLCSLIRSAANVFVPAIILMELIASDNPARMRNILFYIISSLSGIFLVAWLQYSQTGQWMGFMTTQQYWEVKLRFPVFPLHTWGNMQYLDGVCLLAGLVAAGILINMILKFLRKGERVYNKAYIFSLLFISGLTFFTIAFKGGNLFSLNRYLVPTAFFFVAFMFIVRERCFTYKQVAATMLFIFVFWLLFGSYVHIRVLLGYLVFTLYLSLYFLLNHASFRTSKFSFYLLYALNILVQVHLFYKFLGDDWIG
jgi:hypothetical protein